LQPKAQAGETGGGSHEIHRCGSGRGGLRDHRGRIGCARSGAGDAAKGHAFAQQICTECHNIEKGQRPSPNGLAPNFETIAKTPGLTAIALTAALRTSHRTMPNIIIPDDDLRDVVAYVLSLQ
jgi:mono/diheme cytochrome c family protein